MPGRSPRADRGARGWLTIGLLLALAAGPTAAQTDLGGQRVGTSSGAFLKIPLDARGSALGGATCAFVSGPSALFWNPAGLGIEKERGLLFSAVDYAAGIPIGSVALSFPFAPIRGALGIGWSGLGTVMDETDEFHPLGTGREMSYQTWVLTVGASRALTDKLNFGASGKLLYEGLAAEVGGPELSTWLVDAGAIYFVGYRDARIGIALSNFGPDLRPGGEFESRRTGAEVRYTSFSPPTVFRFGCAIDPWRSATWRTLTLLEIGHPADNREILRIGGEASFRETLTLRAGYDFSADALKLHAGFGARSRLGGQDLGIDYAFSNGGYFGDIHRWTLQILW